jgi:hypothetical protein
MPKAPEPSGQPAQPAGYGAGVRMDLLSQAQTTAVGAMRMGPVVVKRKRQWSDVGIGRQVGRQAAVNH